MDFTVFLIDSRQGTKEPSKAKVKKLSFYLGALVSWRETL
jgi:hypothetical protein